MSVTLAAGAVIAGRYELVAPLGQGGMGVVWSACHRVTQKHVALKFVRGSTCLRPDTRRRFSREARAASTVAHPHIVQVFDVFDLDDETPVMVMELLEGETLGSKVAREGALSLQATCEILVPVVSAVGAAHAAGIVHRDLKPENVFLCRTQSGTPDVRVLDFGIAKLVGDGSAALETGVITETGAMLGTPCYMSPEQSFGDKDVDHRADVWSLGVMLYECLSGSRQVDGDSVGQVLKRLMTDGITPISVIVPSLRADIASLVDRMLNRERAERPQDLREVLAVLQHVSGAPASSFGPPRSGRPSSIPSSDPLDVAAREPPGPLAANEAPVESPHATSRSEVPTGGPHAFSPTQRARQRRMPWVAGVLAVATLFGAFTIQRLSKDATRARQPAVASHAPKAIRTITPSTSVEASSPSPPAAPPGSSFVRVAAPSPSRDPSLPARVRSAPSKAKKDEPPPAPAPAASDLASVERSPAPSTSAPPVASQLASPRGFADEPPF